MTVWRIEPHTNRGFLGGQEAVTPLSHRDTLRRSSDTEDQNRNAPHLIGADHCGDGIAAIDHLTSSCFTGLGSDGR